MEKIYDVIIIGAGPAGLAAGLYSSRARLKTLILEKETFGGQMINMDLIENYPGFENGIRGPDLASNMVNQTTNAGAEIEMTEVQIIEPGKDYHVVQTVSDNYYSRAVIIASGSHHRKLGVPGEEEFVGKGVFYCAICDGSPYSNKIVAVAGGGDSGISEALYLTRIASKVMIYEAMPVCSASNILMERARANPKIEIHTGMRIDKISGGDEVRELTLIDSKTGEKTTVGIDGLLVHVGVNPNSDWLKSSLPLNPQGQIKVDNKLRTGVSGIFAAGDVREVSPCQVVTAVGDGSTAALAAQKYLNGIG